MDRLPDEAGATFLFFGGGGVAAWSAHSAMWLQLMTHLRPPPKKNK